MDSNTVRVNIGGLMDVCSVGSGIMEKSNAITRPKSAPRQIDEFQSYCLEIVVRTIQSVRISERKWVKVVSG